MRELGIGHGLAHGAIGGCRHGIAGQRCQNVRRRVRGRPDFEFVHQRGPVGAAVEIFGKTRIGDPVAPSSRFGQSLERALAGDRDVDEPTTRRHRSENRAAGRWRHFELRRLHLDQRNRHGRFQHGHIDVLASSGRSALGQRCADGAERIGARDHVRHVDTAVVGARPSRLVGHVGEVEPGGGVNDGRIGGQLRRGARLPIARDRAVDEPGIEGRQRLVVESQSLHDAGAIVLHQHVGVFDEAFDHGHGVGLLQVEQHAALARIECTVHGAGAVAQRWSRAHHVALGGLELDDVGAQICQQSRAVRASNRRREIQHAQAGISARHGFPSKMSPSELPMKRARGARGTWATTQVRAFSANRPRRR